MLDDAIADCDAIIEWAEEQAEWHRSVLSTGDVSEMRTSDTLGFSFLSYQLPPVVEAMNRAVWQQVDAYAKDWKFGFYGVENVSLQRYKPGQKYDAHADSGPGQDRVCSALVYLNDVKEGGETEFSHVGLSVQPKAGRLVIFPSNFVYLHASLPVRRGVKYAAAFWIKG